MHLFTASDVCTEGYCNSFKYDSGFGKCGSLHNNLLVVTDHACTRLCQFDSLNIYCLILEPDL